MQLRFFTTCLAAIITASTGVSQEPLDRFRDERVADPNAPTPAWDIQLLNPDGTPATDAKVVAVLLAPGGVVDQDLTPRPVPKVDKQPLAELVNENGTVTVTENDTKAIAASNEKGFLFLPASAFGDKAKLREWAHVELDVSTVPDDMRANITLNIMWTNSIQGIYVRPNLNQNNDPLRDEFDRPEKIEPKSDWRFDPMITWTHSVPVTNQTVRVPPGEMVIALASKQSSENLQLPAEMPAGSFFATAGLWRAAGGTTQKVALPEFGIVEGTISSGSPSTLPDWNKSGNETARIVLNHGLFPLLPPILTPSGSNHEYFTKLTSDQGLKVRQDTTFGATTTTAEGKFRFPIVPVSTYAIHQLIEAPGLSSGLPGSVAFRLVPLKPDGDRDTTSVVVSAKNTTTVNLVEAPSSQLVVREMRNADPFTDAEPASAFPTRLPEGAVVEYVEQTRVVDGRAVTVKIPRIVERRSGDPTYLKPEDEIIGRTFEPAPRDAPRFESDPAPVQNPKPDAARLLVQNWLRSAKDPSDQTELRKLLQEHLQQEFEANQEFRQAEIERLQQLLVKSKEWLDQRQQRRDEIIKKRIDELLQQQALSLPEKSGLRR